MSKVGDGVTFGAILRDVLNASGGNWDKCVARVASGGRGKSPHVIVICSGANRCVELLKSVREELEKSSHANKGSMKMTSHSHLLKLWSRHMDMDEQCARLQQGGVGVACGTPNRINKLFVEGKLNVKRTKLVIIDCWANVKGQTVFNVVETRADLLAFLALACVKRMKKGKMKMALL